SAIHKLAGRLPHLWGHAGKHLLVLSLPLLNPKPATEVRNQHSALLEREDCTLVAWYPSFTHLAREGCMTVTIGRRELLAALGGAAAWPLAAHAQQGERTRRIGVLIQVAEGDPQARIEVATFLRGLQDLGWSEGRNLRIDTRWGGGGSERIRKYAAELVAIAPGGILAPGGRGRGRVGKGEPHRANRVRECHRSGRPRLCRKPGTTSRERDWIYLFRIRDGRKMAGGAQGNGAASDPRSSTSRSRHHCGNGICD